MRAFIAIDLSEEIRERLGELQGRLRERVGDIAWVKPERIHLTLKFLGEIEEQQLAPIATALERVAKAFQPFEISVGGIGTFPESGKVNVLWVGVNDVDDKLQTLQRNIEDGVAGLGFPREERPFSPHLTLARNKQPRLSQNIRKALNSERTFEAGTLTVGEVILYQSLQGRDGSRYVSLCRTPFNG